MAAVVGALDYLSIDPNGGCDGSISARYLPVSNGLWCQGQRANRMNKSFAQLGLIMIINGSWSFLRRLMKSSDVFAIKLINLKEL